MFAKVITVPMTPRNEGRTGKVFNTLYLSSGVLLSLLPLSISASRYRNRRLQEYYQC